MRISIPLADLPAPAPICLRQAGYHYQIDRRSGQESYARHLTSADYPRFHIYLLLENGQAVFNLHLDQKRPSYGGGTHAHSGEYEGEIIRGEIQRLLPFLKTNK